MTTVAPQPIRTQPVSSVGGWRAYCDRVSDLVRPRPMSWSEYRGLSSAARGQYDQARLKWLLMGLIIGTDEQKKSATLLRTIMRENRMRGSGEQALLVSGEPTLGKTTLAKKLGRMVEAQQAKDHPDYRRDGIVPVVYVDAPSNGSGKQLLAALDSFSHGGARPARTTQEDLLRYTIESVHALGVRLLIVDEAHLLSEQRRAAQDPTDILKQIQNATPATVLIAGIDLLDPTGLATRRGAQLLDRAEPVEMTRFTATTSESRMYWEAVLDAFDSALPLIDHEPGLFVANQQLIHDATRGSIGLLNKLITRLVGSMVDDADRPDERVTPARLDEALQMIANASRSEKKLGKAKRGGALVGGRRAS